MSHAIRITASTDQRDNPEHIPEPAPPELVNVVPDRVIQNVIDAEENDEPKFHEVLPEQRREISEDEPDPETGGPSEPYLRGLYRFDDDDDKTELVNDIEHGVLADVEWYRIESHECDHEKNRRFGCSSWEIELEHGNVPL